MLKKKQQFLHMVKMQMLHEFFLKHITKKHKIIATLLAILVLAGVFALVIWGRISYNVGV